MTYTGAESEGFIAPTLNDIYEDSICKSIFPSAELDKREATPSQFLIAICFNRGADSLNTANKSTSTAMKKETRRRRVNTRQKGKFSKQETTGIILSYRAFNQQK